MKRTTRTALSVLTSLTLHSIGFNSPTLAETTLTRGPNFAAHPVKAGNVLLNSNAPRPSVPTVVTQGPNGAAPIAQTEAVRDTAAQASGNPTIITRGPHGAAHILN